MVVANNGFYKQEPTTAGILLLSSWVGIRCALILCAGNIVKAYHLIRGQQITPLIGATIHWRSRAGCYPQNSVVVRRILSTIAGNSDIRKQPGNLNSHLNRSSAWPMG
jgi:hypothetical protein